MSGFPRRVYAAVLTSILGCSALVSAGISIADPGEDGVVEVGLSGRGDVVRVISGGAHSDPAQATKKLPVKVVVSYSDGGTTTSDPEVVAGKSGRVRIDVGVFNTTGRIEKVSGDVNGHTISSARWVSTPLSVAGAVRLGGVDPSQVVTADAAGGDDDVTNGIVGVDSDGNTVVQWAGVTGLGSDVARFSLVVNAKDFVVPPVDVLVQPGFGVDPDSNAQRSQSELVTETLKSLSDAGRVLADSGEALERARVVLDQAGTQIGVKTVADLNASNARVVTSASQIASTLNGIEARASGMFSATGSHVAGQLSATTKVVKDLLGDPAAVSEPVEVDPVTCSMQPQPNTDSEEPAGNTSSSRSVLGVVRGLSARLEALAASSAYCQQLLLGDLDSLLGPASPNPQQCLGSNGLSCRLWQAERNMTDVADQSYREGRRLVAGLKDGSDQNTGEAIALLRQRLGTIREALDQVYQSWNGTDFRQQVASVKTALSNLNGPIGDLEKTLNDTADGVGKIGQVSERQDEKLRHIKRLVCVASGLSESDDQKLKAEAYRIGKSMGKELVGLISDTSCPAKDPGEGNSVDGDSPSGSRDSLQALGKTMREQITTVSEDIAPVQGGANVPSGRQALVAMRTSVSDLEQAIDVLLKANADGRADIRKTVDSLERAYAQAQAAFSRVEVDATMFTGHVSNAAESLERHVESSHERTSRVIAETQPTLLDGVNATRKHLGQTSGQVFTGFSNRLTGESRTLMNDTSAVVKDTNRRVEEANNDLSASTTSLMKENNAAIHGFVSTAVVDSQATSKLLADDIGRVLADIGTNTNKGRGLLGAIATSASHLNVADSNLADSTTRMSLTQSRQREAQSGLVLDDTAMRLSLSRLEHVAGPVSTGENQDRWVSFHLRVGEGK